MITHSKWKGLTLQWVSSWVSGTLTRRGLMLGKMPALNGSGLLKLALKGSKFEMLIHAAYL